MRKGPVCAAVCASLLASAPACGDDDAGAATTLDGSSSDGVASDASAPLDAGDVLDVNRPDARADMARDDLGAADAGPVDPLPRAFRVDGSALGASDDDRVTAECTFYGEITTIVPREDGFSGVIAGEVFRFVTVEGMRYEFQALIGGPVDVREVQPGEIVARLVGDQSGPEVKPFWRELEEISAGETEPHHWAGTWQCAPLALDMPGFVDTFLVVPGAWTLVPVDRSP
ncbi:MAG: hypothetical protein IT379_26395 [Deltaproteobacteria bacterium]|nr:hypothetical protein [Deltaproteobacteria bacterium]